MPSPSLPLSLLIGPEHAGQFIGGLVPDLIVSDLLPEPIAYCFVCEGVLGGDPFLLANAGQMRTLRPDRTDLAPGVLFVVRRDTTQLTVEDEHGRRHGLPLCALAD
ncbi:hypothetical protein ACFYMW_38600 [Streptomyces sp. NPDC006692]|uniref:hypothetical protein n=1 Tax=unclassified Streptomyces TaxID=2593676 RepID=UPI0036BEF855